VIPVEEIDRVATAFAEALCLGAQGGLVEGYELLVAGRRRVEALRGRGLPGGHDLVERWQTACDRYCRTLGLPMPE
jgi:hypothetical protein